MALELPALPPLPPRRGTQVLPPLPGAGSGTPRPARDLAPNATLVARVDLTADLARFRLRPDAGVPTFKPGQYLSIGLPGPTGPLLRPDSIASAPGEDDGLAEADVPVPNVRFESFTPARAAAVRPRPG